MARKFSLKDNPIFQRLEIPKPRVVETGFSADNAVEGSDPTKQAEVTPSTEKDRVKIRPSKLDPQNLTLKANSSDSEEDTVNLNPVSQEDKEQDSVTFHHREENIDRQDSAVQELLTPRSEGQNLTLRNKPASLGLQDESLEENTTQAQSPAELGSTNQAIDSLENVSRPGDEYEISQHNKSSRGSESPSNFDPQILTLKKNIQEGSDSREEPEERHVSPFATINSASNPGSSDLREELDKSLFFSFYNEMNDALLPQLDTAEQILYSRLFRLSYGFNRNYCTVSQPVLREKTGLSRNTIRTGLQSLVQKEWVRIVGAGNHVSTTYRIVLPRERNRGRNFDPQKWTLKN